MYSCLQSLTKVKDPGLAPDRRTHSTHTRMKLLHTGRVHAEEVAIVLVQVVTSKTTSKPTIVLLPLLSFLHSSQVHPYSDF
jgi:hypothetical protein